MFMEIAIAAIGIGIVLMVGYLVIAQVHAALPLGNVTNPCLGIVGTVPYCPTGSDNGSSSIVNPAATGITSAQTTVFAGFGLLAVGIIVLAAFGLINVFK